MYFSSVTTLTFATDKRIVSFDVVQDKYSCYLSSDSRISTCIALRLDKESIQFYSTSPHELGSVPKTHLEALFCSMSAFKINQDFTVSEDLMKLIDAYNKDQKAAKILFIKQQNHKATYKAEPAEIFRFLIQSSEFSADTQHCE